MPEPRTMMLMQCVSSPGSLEDGKYWLAETYMTSDGPRMRVIPCTGHTEEVARAELTRREAIVTPPPMVTVEECRRANRDNYQRGRHDAMADSASRARNRPGDGDMGG